jgi:hypothetical protein
MLLKKLFGTVFALAIIQLMSKAGCFRRRSGEMMILFSGALRALVGSKLVISRHELRCRQRLTLSRLPKRSEE